MLSLAARERASVPSPSLLKEDGEHERAGSGRERWRERERRQYDVIKVFVCLRVTNNNEGEHILRGEDRRSVSYSSVPPDVVRPPREPRLRVVGGRLIIV